MRTSPRTTRRGVSLMVVTVFLGVASVMGIAVLSSQTLQSEAALSADLVAQADALAESGINLGLYYLQNLNDSTKCPSTVGNATYKESGVTIGNSINGTFDLTINYNSKTYPSRYTVTAVGKARGRETIQRTLVTTVDVNYFGQALMLWNNSSSTTIPSNVNITGDVFALAGVQNNATISGTLYSTSISGSGSATASRTSTGATYTPVPATVAHYSPLYTYYKDAKSYTTGVIASATTSVSNVTYSTNLITNPAGIYYHVGDLELAGNVKITGTLVVTGKLYVSGTGNTITATANYPALIVDSDINFKTTGAQLTVSGLVYTGAKIAKTSGVTSGTLNITGALLAAGGTSCFDTAVQVNITYDRWKASVPSLTGLSRPAPTSVSILSWKN